MAKHQAKNGQQIFGFCLTNAQVSPDRHTEFCGYLANVEERHERTINILHLWKLSTAQWSGDVWNYTSCYLYIIYKIHILLLSMVGNNHPLWSFGRYGLAKPVAGIQQEKEGTPGGHHGWPAPGWAVGVQNQELLRPSHTNVSSVFYNCFFIQLHLCILWQLPFNPFAAFPSRK